MSDTQSVNTNFLMVKQFNQVFGHPSPKEPQLQIFIDNPEVVTLRNSLINEEISEFKEALQTENVIEMIDALSDIQYVAYGLLVVYGKNGDEEYNSFMESKYTFLDGTPSKETESFTNFNQTKEFLNFMLKSNPAISTPKTFLDCNTEPSFNQTFNRYVNYLEEAYICLENATKETNFSETIKCL